MLLAYFLIWTNTSYYSTHHILYCMVYSTKVDDRAFLQQKILRKIATDGRQSISRLEKELDHHHPPVYSAVQSLVKKNRLQKVRGIGHENKMGRPQKFFDLTGQGILYL